MTSGKKQLPSGTYAGGQQFEYGFDDIGNRTVAWFGGDQSGAGLRPAYYYVSMYYRLDGDRFFKADGSSGPT